MAQNSEPKDPNRAWDVEVPPNLSKFEYASSHSIAIINNKREILIQFSSSRSPVEKHIAVSRIKMHPAHALELILNLQSAVKSIHPDDPPSSRST